MTIQPNVALELRRVAEEFDHLADALVAGELEFNHPEIFKFWRSTGS